MQGSLQGSIQGPLPARSNALSRVSAAVRLDRWTVPLLSRGGGSIASRTTGPGSRAGRPVTVVRGTTPPDNRPRLSRCLSPCISPHVSRHNTLHHIPRSCPGISPCICPCHSLCHTLRPTPYHILGFIPGVSPRPSLGIALRVSPCVLPCPSPHICPCACLRLSLALSPLLPPRQTLNIPLWAEERGTHHEDTRYEALHTDRTLTTRTGHPTMRRRWRIQPARCP